MVLRTLNLILSFTQLTGIVYNGNKIQCYFSLTDNLFFFLIFAVCMSCQPIVINKNFLKKWDGH